MPDNAVSSPRFTHPSPHRARIGVIPLWFGLGAAPLAWALQLLSSTALAGRDCFPHQNPLAEPFFPGLWPVLLAISCTGITLAVAGGGVAWRNWRKTRDELPGSAHHLLDGGEGRTRFMGLSGMIASALFLIALIFGTAALFMVPLCGG
ncbi:MAG: hypothetical protein ABJF23_12225 [Bryobacteraceae bacterium]